MATIADLVANLGMNNAKYMKGISQATAAAEKMQSDIEKISGKIDTSKGITESNKKIADSAGMAGSILEGKLGGALGSVAGVAGRLGPVLAAVGAVAQKAFSIAVSVGKMFLDLLKRIAKAAAVAGGAMAALAIAGLEIGRRWAESASRGQLVRASFDAITAASGRMGSEVLAAMQKAAGGTIDMITLMQNFNQATFLAGEQMAISLIDALPMLQKVAVATGESMDFMLSSMVRGVSRLSPRILDNLGVVVKLEQAYQRWADQNDKTVESMTQAEQQTALLTETMRQLEQKTKDIPDVADSALGAFLRLRTNFTDLKQTLGADLIPTFAGLARAINSIFPAIEAFGRLFTGTLAALVDAGKAFVKGFANALGVSLGGIADDAGAWGSNIVMSLASGMAAAAGAVIQVLNDIAAAIANWLAPGSPPKLLPDLPDWGESAMMEWLAGMGNANLNILREMSGRIARFFRATMGDASTQEIAGAILDARAKLERALGGGADIGAVLEGLPGTLGDYAQALLRVQDATRAVENAQRALNDVQERYSRLLDPINQELDDISDRQREIRNQIERERLQDIIADPDAPAAAKEMARLELRRLALEENKDAIEDERDSAVDAARARLNAARAAQEAAEKQLDAIEMMMEHQIEFNELLQQTIEKMEEVATAGGGGGGGGGGGMELPEIPEVGGAGGLSGTLEESMNELAQRVRGKFDPVIEEFERLGENVGRIVGVDPNSGIRGIIAGFRRGLGQDVDAADVHLMNLGDSFGRPATKAEKVGEAFAKGFNRIRDWFDENKPAINTAILDIVKIIVGLGAITFKTVAWMVETWPKVRKAIKETVERGKENFERFKEGLQILGARVAGWVLARIADFNNLKDTIQERINTIKETIDTKINEAKTAFRTAVDAIKTKANDIFGPGGTVETAVNNVRDKFNSVFGEGGAIATAIDTAVGWIDTIKNAAEEKIKGTLTEILNSFKTGVLDPLATGFNSVKTAIKGVVEWLGSLIEKARNVDLSSLIPFISSSPAPLALGLEQSRAQMARMARTELPALARAAGRLDPMGNMIPQAGRPGGAAAAIRDMDRRRDGERAPDQRTMLGKIAETVEINNQMDLEMFKAFLLQTMEGAE